VANGIRARDEPGTSKSAGSSGGKSNSAEGTPSEKSTHNTQQVVDTVETNDAAPSGESKFTSQTVLSSHR
jgi:hypothetical protein